MKNTKYIYTFPGVGMHEKRVVYAGGAEAAGDAAKEAGKKTGDAAAGDAAKAGAQAADFFKAMDSAPKDPKASAKLDEAKKTAEGKPATPAEAKMPKAAKPAEVKMAQYELKGDFGGAKVSWEGTVKPYDQHVEAIINRVNQGLIQANGKEHVLPDVRVTYPDGSKGALTYTVTVTNGLGGVKNVLIRSEQMKMSR